MAVPDLSAEYGMSVFQQVLEQDREMLSNHAWLSRWFFADVLESRGQRGGMGFYKYEGPEHLRKFFGWIANSNYIDYLGTAATELSSLSLARDLQCARRLNVA